MGQAAGPLCDAGRVRRLELGVYVLLGAAIVASLVLTLVHAGQEVYDIPGYGVAIAVVAGVVAAVAIGVGWRATCGRVVALAAIGGALTVLGVLSLPPVLVVAAALLVLAVRTSRGEHATAAVVAGVLLGIALHVVALIALSPPLVDCATGSAGENVFLGLTSNAASGRGSADAAGTTSRGRARGETYEYTYSCRDGRLVDFELRNR
jgi:hypothetical protein